MWRLENEISNMAAYVLLNCAGTCACPAPVSSLRMRRESIDSDMQEKDAEQILHQFLASFNSLFLKNEAETVEKVSTFAISFSWMCSSTFNCCIILKFLILIWLEEMCSRSMLN